MKIKDLSPNPYILFTEGVKRGKREKIVFIITITQLPAFSFISTLESN
jgi:hypothetical protein